MKYFFLFSLLVLLSCSWGQECSTDEDCAVGYRCFEGNCIKVVCPIGHTVENHTCVYTSMESSGGAAIEEAVPTEETEPEPETVGEPTVEMEEPVEEPEISETEVVNETNETEETRQEETNGEMEKPEGDISIILLLVGIIVIGTAIVIYMTYFKKIK
jgi:hypothetical protein